MKPQNKVRKVEVIPVITGRRMGKKEKGGRAERKNDQ
jgi:hypothetical protein